MKLIIVFTFMLMMFITTLAFKYVKISMHQGFDTQCTQRPLLEFYQLSGYCSGGNIETKCNENGTIISQTLYKKNSGCQGKPISTESFQENQCQPIVNSQYSCVNDYEIPQESLVFVDTNKACQDDPTWKNEINVIGFYYLNYCFQGVAGSFEIVCNSSVPYRTIYNSTDCSDSPTGYSWYKTEECSKSNPSFQYCNI
ncbi:hypothetical protein ACTFIV_007302 [Dictyostelium citrinum]